MGFRSGESYPYIINNFVFPDDLVGTVGNTATDPFASRRDSNGKIYSNFHFEWNLNEGTIYGSDDFSIDLNTPAPVITLDFSESKWNYKNSKLISVTINNSARLAGGGGAGGHGVRLPTTTNKRGDVSAQTFGGGGGGAGAGSGRNDRKPTPESYIGWNGVGLPGNGWPHSQLQISSKKIARNGTRGSRWDVAGSGGAKAELKSTENISTTSHTAHVVVFGHGSDGGDVFEIINPVNVQPIIVIRNSNTGIIIAGGGGGAGGYEVDGGSGGTSGEYGQSTYGRRTFYGGNPGSVIASRGGTYTRPVYIENANTGIVRGWNSVVSANNKSNTSTGITTGWTMAGNSNTYYIASTI